ncbi:hypothetical protein BS329_35420 [Amycolatopsis coloradensis]|uniref:Uncharacterized protein n=1 Tax=Amycolatopsis coloradensis TaxID=76021 RepID=A0A1R0KHA0_9PSEU|nr:hypothetical protein BS329_35420 [Amycolatopsis coloradensis]
MRVFAPIDQKMLMFPTEMIRFTIDCMKFMRNPFLRMCDDLRQSVTDPLVIALYSVVSPPTACSA